MEQPLEKKKKVNRIMPIVLGAVLIAGGAIGGSAWVTTLLCRRRQAASGPHRLLFGRHRGEILASAA